MLKSSPISSLPHGSRHHDYPNTHIAKILVSLDGPDHPVTVEWAGPHAQEGETGPFRSSPGAGVHGHSCDDVEASRRSGSKCTPKGTFLVEGFTPHLSDDSRATHVTWFKRDRAIGLHFFPEVPPYAASHGCVRLESDHVAKLIYDNAIAGTTEVIIEGTWTKPPHQWPS